jgi:hypothetical protein
VVLVLEQVALAPLVALPVGLVPIAGRAPPRGAEGGTGLAVVLPVLTGLGVGRADDGPVDGLEGDIELPVFGHRYAYSSFKKSETLRA